jgi:micrococcal nuclease
VTSKKKEESKSKRLQRLIKSAYPKAYFIERVELPGREGKEDLGVFTETALLTFNLDFAGSLQQTAELVWEEGTTGEVDHFAMHSKFRIGMHRFQVINNGKAIAAFLTNRFHMQITTVERKWHQKILGFRSGKTWKKVTAVIIYLFMLSAIMNLFDLTDDEGTASKNETSSEKIVSATSETSADTKDAEKKQTEENSEQEKEDIKQSTDITEDQKETDTEQASEKETTDSASVTPTTSKATKTSGTKERVIVTLVKTVDGDTIKVNYNGKEETVRYLLIDTPETKHPNECVQPFGQEASNRNKQLVNSGKLELEFDVGERKDKYGRLLAYVYVDGKSVQKTLLKEGLARVAYVYPPNTRYLDDYEASEASASNDGIAIWEESNYVGSKGFNGCVEEKRRKKRHQLLSQLRQQSQNRQLASLK